MMATDQDKEGWLDGVLREQPDYIPDAGFTARVMAAAPETRRPRYRSRNVVLLAATLVSCIAGLILPGVASYVLTSLTAIFTLESFSPDKLAVLVPIGLLYWAGLSAAAAER
jgi:hypothetical protein